MTAIGQGLADVDEKLTMLIYGQEGSAKSTEALGLSRLGKIVVIDAEGGLKPTPLKNQGIVLENVEVWPSPEQSPNHITFDTIEQEVFIPMKIALEADPNAYIGIVIDSFSELYQRLTQKAAAESRLADRAKGKTRGDFDTQLGDYGVSTSMMRQILRRFRDLNIHLVITALERRDVDENTSVVTYGPAVGPATATDTMGLVDVVVWAQYEELGVNSKPFFTGTTRPREMHRAKDRFNVLPVRMIEPSADRILGYLSGSITKSKDPRHIAAATAARET